MSRLQFWTKLKPPLPIRGCWKREPRTVGSNDVQGHNCIGKVVPHAGAIIHCQEYHGAPVARYLRLRRKHVRLAFNDGHLNLDAARANRHPLDSGKFPAFSGETPEVPVELWVR